MTQRTRYHPVVIDAPDGPAALALEHRLSYLAPVSIAHGQRWTVDLPAVADPDELDAAVSSWLTEIGERSTSVRVDRTTKRIMARPGRHPARPVNASFIG
jgi:hypothetical protein